MNKSNNAYKTIGEVVKILQSESNRKDNLAAHTLRFWEKQFKQLKPKILNGNRRYYDEKSIKILKEIYFLLKEQGMTINGAKKLLNNKESLKLDEITNHSIKANIIKNKLIKISNLVKGLKK